ncbi:MAG: primosomal protein N' [Candidatus Saganbacteria bacterium]|nr:primosomal protein N' [Candidatus Saganbacteria bacterium]
MGDLCYTTSTMYAEVILSKPSRDLDRIYHYSIPLELSSKIQIGSQVKIPFGKREEVGYVVGFSETTDIEATRIKPIAGIISEEPIFDRDAVEIADWISNYYLAYKISCLRLIMPPGTRGKEKLKKPAKAKMVQGSVDRVQDYEIKNGLSPTPEQARALETINELIEANRSETILLYGVTASGKTEVYLQAIANVLIKGKNAIVLVPEVGLTPQLVERFKERFSDHIAIFHSGLTEKKRKTEWLRVKNGLARIVLGTRIALFAPLKNIGIIVLDEEYEVTYKQEQSPKYHAREVAGFLAKRANSPLVLGSATPTVETFYKAKQGEYKLQVLPHRIDNRPFPEVKIVDMKEEQKAGNLGVLSRDLRKALVETFKRGEQAILFLNRIGFFTAVICRDCGKPLKCPHCSVALIYYPNSSQLACNHCNYKIKTPVICPNCQSTSIRYVGTGTQRIEQEVAVVYPKVRILRFDRDTTAKKGAHEAIYGTFKEGKADVLIGTQMVTKGLDIANVTLVAAVLADTSLSMPDFRAAEHTFQLLTQVAGRAGRHHLPGKVIIQTYNPDHCVIQAAAKHDYDLFFNEEIKTREDAGFPPFSSLINILFASDSLERAQKTAEDLQKFLAKRLKEEEVLGPIPAAIPKLKGMHRFQILLKGKDLDVLRLALQQSLQKLVIPKDVRVVVDVEPINIL